MRGKLRGVSIERGRPESQTPNFRIKEKKEKRHAIACSAYLHTRKGGKEAGGLDKITKHDGTKIDSLFADLDDMMIKNYVRDYKHLLLFTRLLIFNVRGTRIQIVSIVCLLHTSLLIHLLLSFQHFNMRFHFSKNV